MSGLEGLWHPLEAFYPGPPPAGEPDYYYEGHCLSTGEYQRLPRTPLAKAVAQGLMAQLGDREGEGKMYGVLLVCRPDAPGEIGVLKAFSGLWRGQPQVPGWVPPVPGRGQVALQEAHTLAQLEAIADRLRTLQALPERQIYASLEAERAAARQALQQRHQQRRQQRQRQRQALPPEAAAALAALDQQSRGDKAELRRFKQGWRDRLGPLAARLAAADSEVLALKRRRREISRQLQADLHAAHTLSNFAGQVVALPALGALPTGTGHCCAPKLLHAAAQGGLVPLALAEFWWGPPQGDRQPGQFYGACADRCQPILGFLLGGLAARVQAAAPRLPCPPVIYRDRWLIALDKPAGLLSVPGRYGDRQDSALTRLSHSLPPGTWVRPVHRLDQDTSGVLLLALDPDTHRQMGRQFEQRRVAKTYQAVAMGTPASDAGLIDLPLGADPAQRPRQTVDWQRGKPSQTRYQVLDRTAGLTRLALWPLTGRTHQLRVHAALGLGTPILGDRLYGPAPSGDRLHLHAQTLELSHPHRAASLTLAAPVPF